MLHQSQQIENNAIDFNNDSNYLSNSNTLAISMADFQDKLRLQFDESYAIPPNQTSESDRYDNDDIEISLEIADIQ